MASRFFFTFYIFFGVHISCTLLHQVVLYVQIKIEFKNGFRFVHKKKGENRYQLRKSKGIDSLFHVFQKCISIFLYQLHRKQYLKLQMLYSHGIQQCNLFIYLSPLYFIFNNNIKYVEDSTLEQSSISSGTCQLNVLEMCGSFLKSLYSIISENLINNIFLYNF